MGNTTKLASSSDSQAKTSSGGVAIVGVGCVMPDAADARTFWSNIVRGHVAIREVPPERWDPALYWSADRSAPDKSYSKIGGFLREQPFDAKRFRIPPKTLESVDTIQRLTLTAVAEALEDAGLEALPGSGQGRPFDRARTAVIMGNAMGGEWEDLTSLRCWYPRMADAFRSTAAARALDEGQRQALLTELEAAYKATLPPVTEDSMPGELSNCITGRICNALDLQGANFTTDAACASSMAALKCAVDGLRAGTYEVAIVGGADQMMDPPAYVKFSKIGALSATMSAPFDARADGFVMGEGVGVLVLKRLEDAERDGDKIYAVVRGIGAASDGKGKGMTAPNPRGQRMAIERAYAEAGIPITSVSLFEAHGTSTRVGDAVEAGVLTDLLKEAGGAKQGVALGSVKSMIGHLKAAAGAAALVKVALALHHKQLPPSAGYERPPEGSPLAEGYLAVNTTTRNWTDTPVPRRAGVSAFGFGGTNFHAVLEEHRPTNQPAVQGERGSMKSSDVLKEVIAVFAEKTGYTAADLDPAYALEADLGIDTVKQAEVLGVLRERYGVARDDNFKLAATPTLQAIADYLAASATAGANGRGEQVAASSDAAPPVVAISSSGAHQAKHVAVSPSFPMFSSASVAATHSWSVVVAGGEDVAAAAKAGEALLARANAWPQDVVSSRAVYRSAPVRVAFAADGLDAAKTKMSEVGRRKARLLAAQGIFVAEGTPLADRGKVAFLFPGQGSQFLGMFQDLAELYPVVRDTFFEADRVLEPLIGGKLTAIVWASAASDAEREQADLRLRQTEICQPAMLTADVALYRLLLQLGVKPDMVAGHSLGEYAACVAAQVMSFADALYAVSARGREMAHVKVEDCGKMASVAAGADRVEPVLREIPGYVIAANKNCHAQTVIAGGTSAVEAAIQRFLDLGIEAREIPVSHAFHSQIVAPASTPLRRVLTGLGIQGPTTPITCNVDASYYPADKAAVVELLGRQLESPVEFIAQIERMYADGARLFVEVGPRRAVTGFVRNVLGDREHQAIATNHHKKPAIDTLMEALAALAAEGVPLALEPSGPTHVAHAVTLTATVEDLAPVISGVAAIFPTAKPLAEVGEDGFERVLAGENFITPLEPGMQQAMLDMSVVRLDKDAGVFKPLRELADVIQLAARAGDVDLVRDFGLDEAFDDALDRATRLAMAVGIDALRDAGIPLVRRYRTTSTGKQLPDRWALAPEMARTTGVIFASAFPGYNRFVEEVTQRVTSGMAGRSARELRELAHEMRACVKEPAVGAELDRLIEAHAHRLDDEAARYTFNRKFLFRVLAMGHAQMAQYLGAQGPNTSVNAACASGPMALAIAADWLELGRCERVLVLSADDVTSDGLLPFMGAGFLAAGAATVESDLSRAAVPFGTERNGMILGSGAAGFVVERDQALTDRGMTPIAELVEARFSNAAFHGTRLDSPFIADAMTDLVRDVCDRTGLSRDQLARELVFMSHETYTPARGGSSAAEVDGLRAAFGESVNEVTVANVKGFTGHPMAVGLEDAVAVKILQHQQVPPVANLRDVDPAFAGLRFARGGRSTARFAFHFAAGFGSQVAMAVFRQRATGLARLVDPARYEAWLAALVGREGAGLELAQRTLRVAEQGGVRPWELGVPSLVRSVAVSAIPAETRVQTTVSVAPSAVPPVPEATPAPADRETLLRELQALFAERTGYDVQDLDPTFQLEADLGIDTVKQAEILAVVRERYGLGKDDGFKLASVPTLAAVADYVATFRTTAPAPAVTPAAPTPAAMPAPMTTATARETLVHELQALFAERTGYDVQDLDPTFQLEADLGIDTVKQAEILAVVRERYGLGKDDGFKLASVPTLAAVADYVASRRAPPPPPQPSTKVSPAAVIPHQPSVVSSSPKTDVSPAPDRARLLVEVTQLFAERTGYAVSDLEPTYQLEADLGIDTVKQAEILAAIRERYGLGKDERFSLADVQTLEAVTSYVVNRLGQAAPKDRAAPVVKRWDAQGRFKLWTVTAVELASTPARPARSLAGRNVVLAGADGVLVQAMRAELVRRGANVHALPADVLDAETLFARIANAAGRPIDDLVYVVGDHASLAPIGLEADVSRAFRLARDFGRVRRELGGAGVLFVGRSRGAFGLTGDDPTGVVMGAIAGLAKTLAKEWRGARCLAIDCERSGTPVDTATRALDEFCHETPVEVALHEGKRLTLRRGDEAAVDAVQLPARPVVVATGGARGVTYEILRDFAARHTAKIVILARTSEPRAGSTSLEGKSDEQLRELGRAAVAAAGERVTPAAIKRWVDAEHAKLQVAAHLATLRQLGSEVELIACDVADLATVAKVAAQIRQRYGAVDLLLHGAGREESKLLADKDAEAFERVFAPKARAGIALWSELAPKRTVVMGSVAGRFGNAGQADYAAANELLAAFARAPERRVLAVDWTAWADVGMATKDSVRQFLESSGVEFLPAEVGARMGSELMGSSLTGDIVAAGGLGVFGDGEPPVPSLPGAQPRGADAVALAVSASADALPVLFDRIEARGDTRVYLRRLDVARDRGLDHHRIDGVPVLPGVMGVELMVEAAAHHAGRPVARLEDVSFDLPLKLHRDQALDAQVEVVAKGNGVECRVVTDFVGPGGRTQRREHFRAHAVLGAPSTADAGPPHRLEMPRDPQITRDAIYQRYFHGPVFQVLTGEVLLGEDGVRAELVETWPAWTGAVSHTAYETLPLAREAGFQAAGLWEMVELGRMALPAAVASIELGSRPAPGTKLVVEARRTSAGTSGSTFDVWIRDEAGKVYDVMRGYRTVKLRDLAPTERFEPRRHSGSAPTWFVVEVSEVQSMLAASSEAALARYLSSTEQLRFHELKTDKRRIEWLAGRIAAKRLLREVSFAREGAVVPYAAITIASDELGAPRVSIVGDSRPAPALSITHSAGIAAALVALEPGVRPGIDVEVVEVRDASFARDYFTDAERAAATTSPRPELVLTSTWAVKESVIKALGVGARVDLREVETIEHDGGWHVTLHGEAQRRAQALGARTFEVQLDVHTSFVMARVMMRQDADEAKAIPSLPAKEVLA